MAERIDYFDALRGLAIVGVVTIHASGSGIQVVHETLDYYLTIFWRNFWNFSVPLFLSISGYFLAKKSFSCLSDFWSFLNKQIPRVYWPLLFWSFLWLFLAIAHNASVYSELVKLVTFQSSGPYYFIALIVQYYLLLPILKHLADFKGLVISIVLSLFMTCIIFYTRYFTAIELALIIYAGNCLTWLMFFIFGLYLGTGKRITISNHILLGLTVLFYILSCLESWMLIELFNQPKDAVTAIKPSSFLYAFTLISYLFKNTSIVNSITLKRLGGLSFGIYLTHMFVLNFESRVLKKLLPGLDESSFLHQVILTGLVVLTCAAVIGIIKKMIPEKLSSFIGFK